MANLSNEFNRCINSLKLKTHSAMMKQKNHTIHCYIHRHLGYFTNVYTLWDLHKFARGYMCEHINWEQYTDAEYNEMMNEPCTYFNVSYVNLEYRATSELTAIKIFE